MQRPPTIPMPTSMRGGHPPLPSSMGPPLGGGSAATTIRRGPPPTGGASSALFASAGALPTASSSATSSSSAPPLPFHKRTVETDRGDFAALQFGSTDLNDSSPVVFYLHGAGVSSWGYFLQASALYCQSKSDGAGREVRGFAYDLRCHGDSCPAYGEGGEDELTMHCLVQDTIHVIRAALKQWYPAVRAIYLVGHSLGGAIVANVMQLHKELGFTVAAAAVLDVVEGTAKQSLQHMKGFLDRRPKSFAAKKDAIKWFLGAGGIKNSTSAELSVPHSLVEVPKEGGGGGVTEYHWRTDLLATLPLWEDWFADLDRKFLAIPCPKMLCLALTDRLDKELTIGHMMGKFQLEVVGASNNCGHYVMEDCPEIVAGKLLRMIRRIDALYAKLPVLNHQQAMKAEANHGVGAAAGAPTA